MTHRVFKHFQEGSLEVKRIGLALITFSGTLALVSAFLWWGYSQQQKDYAREIRALTYQVTKFKDLAIPDRENLKFVSETFDREIKNNAMVMLGTYNDDEAFLNSVGDKFLKPIALAQSLEEKNERVGNFLNFASSVIVKRHPIFLYRKFLLAWFVIGVIHLTIIFSLYYFGFDPAVGEPTFNIIDVGFIAVLVQYTGGLANLFLAAYAFSLFLASYDFVQRRAQMPFVNRRRIVKIFLILGPYLFALFLSLFWATCSGWLSGDMPWQQYVSIWAFVSFGATIGITILCAMISYFLEREKTLSQPATQP